MRAFARRYADLAFRTARQEADEARRAELLEMSRILSKVPYGPAESFREAVQALWLTHLVLQIESNGHSLSYGRMDQYLDPYYEADLAAGRITAAQADELLATSGSRATRSTRSARGATPSSARAAPSTKT